MTDCFDDSSDEDQHAAGLTHGMGVALMAQRGVPARPGVDMRKACADAVRVALEAAVVDALFSGDVPEAFLDGLLQAQRTLTMRHTRRSRGSRR